MHYVYVIRSQVDGRFYVGMTADVAKRIKENNVGRTKSTKGYKPWDLVFIEMYPIRLEARVREKYLKGGAGKEFIKNLWSETIDSK